MRGGMGAKAHKNAKMQTKIYAQAGGEWCGGCDQNPKRSVWWGVQDTWWAGRQVVAVGVWHVYPPHTDEMMLGGVVGEGMLPPADKAHAASPMVHPSPPSQQRIIRRLIREKRKKTLPLPITVVAHHPNNNECTISGGKGVVVVVVVVCSQEGIKTGFFRPSPGKVERMRERERGDRADPSHLYT